VVAQAESIISEINQIRAQYVKEVGDGRRAWPVSIKDRVAKLESLGMTAKSVASETGISYATIVLWRHKRRKREKAFHEVQVAARPALTGSPSLLGASNAITISKSSSVTLPNLEIPSASTRGRSLSLRVPSGYLIGGLDEASVIRLIATLSMGAGNAT
jgi:hypothetical protein